MVSSLLDTKRALLLKQQYSAKPWHLPREVKQELCMTLKLVDSVNGYKCAGKMLQTHHALPSSIKIKGKEGPPELAMEYECKQTNPNADVWDLEYPMEVAMVDTIINRVVQDLSRTLQIPTDEQNNAADDTQRQSVQPRRR